MTYGTQLHLRISILSGVLALGLIAKFADSHPRLFGWPGAYILSDWTPGPLRASALQSLSVTLSKDDVPLLKRMLYSGHPRIRRRGILFFDRLRSMDEFFELERMTRDPDPEVRAAAYKFLPFPRDESLAIDVLIAGLKDDSYKVVAVAASSLHVLRAKRALPELIDYMEARRSAGEFNRADVIVGNVAAELAGLKLHFAAYGGPWVCGNGMISDELDIGRPFLWALHATGAFILELLGKWDDAPDVEPYAQRLVEPSVVADGFAARDQLLTWWAKQRHPGPNLGSGASRSRKVRKSSR